MNKKQREVIENLITYAERFTDSDDAHYDWELRKRALATIAAAEKLLNPPVRFLWSRDLRGGYVVDIAGVNYTVRRDYMSAPGYEPWLSVIGRPAEPEKYQYHRTLTAAKQACVDHGVALHRAKTKAAQIHTDPAIRA